MKNKSKLMVLSAVTVLCLCGYSLLAQAPTVADRAVHRLASPVMMVVLVVPEVLVATVDRADQAAISIPRSLSSV